MNKGMDIQFWYWLGITGVILIRYLLIAGTSYGYFYCWKKEAMSDNKLQPVFPGKRQVELEITYSLRTLLIYSAASWFFLDWLMAGKTMHYREVADFGWGYLIGSFLGMVLLHDMYFYWSHRIMHHPRVFRWTHRTHHNFRNPTPWCAFAFHPIEAVVSMGIIPLIVFFIPWHYYAFGAFITFMNFYDIYIHLGFRLPGFRRLKLPYTAELHDLHHTGKPGNYGLYFTFWDRLMGTYRPKSVQPGEPHLVSG
jgi:sterol desaturase/sphingolipid hydroxylase (fatty acid hydroxylase superfamily)